MSDFPDEEQRSAAVAVEELVSANVRSTETMQRLVEHIQAETEARDRKIEQLGRNQHTMRWLVVLGMAATAVLLVIAVFNANNLSSQRREAKRQVAIAEQVALTNQFLLDCTNPTSACGKAGLASQDRLLGEVKKYELTGFYCIRNNPAGKDPDAEDFLKCMDRLYPGGPQLQGR